MTVITGILKKITIEQTIPKYIPKYVKIKSIKRGITNMDFAYVIMNRIVRKYECFHYYVMYNSDYGL